MLANQLVTPEQLAASAIGATKQQNGTDFENLFAESCKAYYEVGLAYINKIPNPTRPISMGGRLYFALAGKPDYDFAGFLLSGARSIGVECKSSSKREPSMPIVAPGKEGHGVAYHQLEALANLARCGGVAKVLWDNGGIYCMLEEPAIIQAHTIYVEQYKAGLAGRPAPRGSKSILASLFSPVDIKGVGGKVCLDWLKSPQGPQSAQP